MTTHESADADTPASMHPSQTPSVFHEQVRQLYAQSPAAVVGMPFVAAVLAAMLWDTLPASTLGIWNGLILALTAVRLMLATRFHNADPGAEEIAPWSHAYTVLELASGITWGTTGFILPYLDIVHQMFVVFVIAGMTAAAAGILAPLMRAVVVYVVPTTLLFAAGLASLEDMIFRTMSLLTLVYGGVMLGVALLMHNFIRNSLFLRFEKVNLLQDLQLANHHLKQEITEHERTDARLRAAKNQAEAANRAKSEFLANMSHELRTPLNGIIGTANLLSKTPLGEEQAKYLSLMSTSGRTLLELVNSILDLAKIESGKLEVNAEPIRLREAMERDTRTLALQAQQKGLAFRLDCAADLPAVVKGDAGWLRQVLVNLVANAVKFTTVGGIVVHITREDSDGHTAALHFAVEDTGIGIAADKLSVIFDSFTQADNSLSREYGGTGLGTTIARNLVERMGGKIWVQSRVGEGSVFHFVLPFEVVTTGDDTATGAGNESAAVEPTGRPLRILLAEDNKINQVVIQDILESFGHEVEIAANGCEAIQRWEQSAYDVILMDVQMPGTDGLQATRIIREREKEKGTHTTIIAMTANAMQDDREKCLAAGMDDYFSKPVDVEELRKTLQPLTQT